MDGVDDTHKESVNECYVTTAMRTLQGAINSTL